MSISPPFYIAGIPVTIRLEDLGDDCINEAIDESGTPTATVRMKCAWSQRYALFSAMKGTSVAVGHAIYRTAPYAYPTSPNLYCLSISDVRLIKPRTVQSGSLAGWVVGQWCTFTANFGVPKFGYDAGTSDPSKQPWTTTTCKVSAEVLQPPGGSFYIGPFPSTTKPEESSVGIIRANVEISMVRHFVPYVPLEAAMALMQGCINSAPIQFSDHVFLPGTLLFAGFDSKPSNDPAGNPTQELTYCLLGKDDDWNKFISKDGSLQLLNKAADGSGDGPYISGNFSILP